MKSPSDVSGRNTAAVGRRHPCALAAGLLMATGGALAPMHAANAQQTLPEVTVRGVTTDGAYTTTRSSTATKTDTPLIDTPQSISIVNKTQISDQGAQGLAEALEYVPGVNFSQGEGNRDQIRIRSVSTTGDFYVDGVRDDVQYYRDLYNIERVEVLRGPNAMVFGRGATGGLINRATKTPFWTPAYSGSLTFGSYGNKRTTVDLNHPLGDRLSLRLNGVYENSGSYRDGVHLRTRGINPTLAWKVTPNTLATFGYEYFEDHRTSDRGISSYHGRPLDTARGTFFGNVEDSYNFSKLNAFTAVVEHEFEGGAVLKNQTRITDQEKFYQNVFPGATSVDGTQVAISAYNHPTKRQNFFNQTDLTMRVNTGSVQHTLLAGVEVGHQNTDDGQALGFFSGGERTIQVPVTNPLAPSPERWDLSRDRTSRANTIAGYFQDQIEITPKWQVIAGLRYDRFRSKLTDNLDGSQLSNDSNLLSPRVGLVYKPASNVSLYGNYSVAYMPRAGDQLTSLTTDNTDLKPEKFRNYEVGVKWDVTPRLAATAALFQLDRSNVVVLDPSDPNGIETMLSKGQRVRGLEATLTGRLTPAWSVAGGYAYTDAKLVADTSPTLRAGAAVGQTPKHTFSLWSRYNFTPQWGAALGMIYRSKMLGADEQIATAANNHPNVTLPGYTRFDGAVFYKFNSKANLQMNVENIFDRRYILNAHNNNNITPGGPRTFRVTLNASF